MRAGTFSVGFGVARGDTRSCFSPMDWAWQLHGASEIPTNPKQLPCKCIMSSLLILSCNKELFSTAPLQALGVGNFKRRNDLVAEKRVFCLFVCLWGWGSLSMGMRETSWISCATFNEQNAFTFTISSDSHQKRLSCVFATLLWQRGDQSLKEIK